MDKKKVVHWGCDMLVQHGILWWHQTSKVNYWLLSSMIHKYWGWWSLNDLHIFFWKSKPQERERERERYKEPMGVAISIMIGQRQDSMPARLGDNLHTSGPGLWQKANEKCPRKYNKCCRFVSGKTWLCRVLEYPPHWELNPSNSLTHIITLDISRSF